MNKLPMRHALATIIIFTMALMALGGGTETTLPTKNMVYSLNDVSSIAKMVVSKDTPKKRNIECFPSYKKSSYLGGKYCVTNINIGPVIFTKTAYKVQNKEHCSLLVGKMVRTALNSNLYQKCQNGEFI
jgi:hypothetical protein